MLLFASFEVFMIFNSRFVLYIGLLWYSIKYLVSRFSSPCVGAYMCESFSIIACGT